MNFNEFSLHEDLLKGIAKAGYVTCTPVQEQVLKTSLDGSDLYVQSQTGTGKTAAYIIPLIQEMLVREEVKGKKALVLVPTRELAVQVEEESKKLLSGTNLKAFSFYGGVGYDKQIAALKNNVDFIIGTPGRVIDLQKSKQMDLSQVNFLVIDEADRMFDMGFYPDLRTLLNFLPKAEERQTFLFSATLNTYVKNLAWEYTRDAKEVTIEAERITVDEIAQELVHVSSDEKIKLLIGILKRDNPQSVLIFCNTKRGCEVIGKRLRLNDIKSEYIIGDMQQSKRLKVLEDFKAGKVSVLVATDVAARGIDVSDLAMVINYDLPNESENYVHRIGRTARAGKSGKAYTFCCEKDVYDLPPIERYIGYSIPSVVCNADMLAEDKSSGVYIKTDNYEDDRDNRHDDKRSYSRKPSSYDNRRPSGDRRNNSSRPNNRSYDNSKNGNNKDYKKTDYRKSTQKPNYDKNRQFDKKSTEDISKLSFDERMAIYKEKYAQTSKPNNNQNYRKPYGYNKNKKPYNQTQKKQGKPNYNQKNNQQKKQPVKQGLFQKIKNLFGRKK